MVSLVIFGVAKLILSFVSNKYIFEFILVRLKDQLYSELVFTKEFISLWILF